MSHALDLRQERQQRAGEARPEDNRIHILWAKPQARRLPGVEGVWHLAETRPQPVHHPLGVKGGDIGTAAGADNHRARIIPPRARGRQAWRCAMQESSPKQIQPPQK